MPMRETEQTNFMRFIKERHTKLIKTIISINMGRQRCMEPYLKLNNLVTCDKNARFEITPIDGILDTNGDIAINNNGQMLKEFV